MLLVSGCGSGQEGMGDTDMGSQDTSGDGVVDFDGVGSYNFV